MRFEYGLTGSGWAKAALADGDTTFELTVSYLTDAPRILLDRLLYLADGGEVVIVEWARDPGDFVWRLAVGEQQELTVQIWEFLDDTGPGSFRPGPLEGSAGLLRFEARTTVMAFASAVAAGFRACISRTGVEAYRRQWDAYEFPQSLLEAVERWVRTSDPDASAPRS